MSFDYAIRVLIEKGIFLRLILYGGLDYRFTRHEIKEINKDTAELEKAIEILKSAGKGGKG